VSDFIIASGGAMVSGAWGHRSFCTVIAGSRYPEVM